MLAGGKYLQTRPDVDPNRVGIWGLSYGGVLTAQALARNSDIFKAGVDLAGVHLWGSSLDPERLVQVVRHRRDRRLEVTGPARPRRRRSQRRVSADDRPRAAAARSTTSIYELIVFPDDTHESMLHSRWIYTLDRMETFLEKSSGRWQEDHDSDK